jgi:hypothetical protein
MTKNLKYIALWLLVTLLASACSKDGADGNEVTNRNEAKKEISFKADVWKMAEATRATTYDNTTLQSGGFKCTVYDAGTATVNTDANINERTVSWNGSRWVFDDGSHYWPTSGDLDFFAYAPTSLPSYVAVIYAVAGTPAAAAPHFTCSDLPLSLTLSDPTQEFIWALTTGQNRIGQGESGVTMTFRHPFARVKFKKSASSSTNVTVTSITIPAIYRDGTCTLTGTGNTATSTWSSLSDNDEDFVISGSPATNDDTFYLVIPNNYGSKTLSVAITWKEWDVEDSQTLTAPLDFNWAAGYSYTYSLTITKDDLKVDIEKFTEQW